MDALSENQPPSALRGGSGLASARKVTLGGATPLAPTRTPGLAPRGLGTPAAGAKTGGSSRAVLGDISNCKRPAGLTTQPSAIKRQAGGFDEVAAVVAAATELGFAYADDDLPSPERVHPAEPVGPVPLDRSGFDVEATIATMCAQRTLALGGTPYEQRSRARHMSQQPPVFAEVPPSPANASSSLASLAARGSSRAVLLPQRRDVEAHHAPSTWPTAPPSATTAETEADSCDEDEAEELPIDLARFELVPPTPHAADAPFDDDDEGEGEEETPAAEQELESVAPLDLSSRLAGLAIDH